MSINIKGLSGRSIKTGNSGQASAAKGSKSASAGQTQKSAGGDTVSLTESASQLQELAAQVASLPVADPARVSGVQRSLSSGNFQFEPEEAAENLITQERELALAEESKDK